MLIMLALLWSWVFVAFLLYTDVFEPAYYPQRDYYLFISLMWPIWLLVIILGAIFFMLTPLWRRG